MTYVRIIGLWAVSGLFFIVTGCSKEYDVLLYNFYGSPIEIVSPSVFVDEEGSALLYNSLREEHILLPALIRIRFSDGVSCYSLEKIGVGGYAQYGDSHKLTVRLRLNRDKKIYVYNVKSGFQKNAAPGAQPRNYPITPEACRDTGDPEKVTLI